MRLSEGYVLRYIYVQRYVKYLVLILASLAHSYKNRSVRNDASLLGSKFSATSVRDRTRAESAARRRKIAHNLTITSAQYTELSRGYIREYGSIKTRLKAEHVRSSRHNLQTLLVSADASRKRFPADVLWKTRPKRWAVRICHDIATGKKRAM